MKNPPRFKQSVFFAAILFWLAACEWTIMQFLPRVHASNSVKSLVDSLLIALLTSPVIYVLLFRPQQNRWTRSEKRNEVLLEHAPDPIVILNTAGIIKSMNKTAERVSGYAAGELVGKQFARLGVVAPIFLPKVTKEFFLTLTENERDPFEADLILKDGTHAAFEIHAHMIRYKNKQMPDMLVIFRDIRERKLIQERMLLQSRALEAASNGIVITDNQGTIQWVNKSFTEITGYSSDEAIGQNPRILKSGEQTPEAYENLWFTILAGKTWVGELINRRKDGSLYFEKQTITPVKDEKGKFGHFIAIKEDISGDKRLEAQFRQAQKMEAVGRLAGGVAHDFNNLLTVILGQCDLLLGDLPAGSELKNGLTEIRDSGLRASQLTRQLLAFSRKQIFQIKTLDINEIVRGSDKLLRRLLGEDIELVTLLGEKLRPIHVDPAQIDQVIMNLAVNARDAMPKGGKLLLETSESRVDAKMAQRHPGLVPGEYVLLTIRDNGTGIAPETMAHLFEPFFTTKGQGKGTGLGLATVYGIIKQSKGYIYAESELNKGATFLIFLPPSEHVKTADTSLEKPVLPHGSETILVAEDEELVRGLAVQVLTRQGFHVLEARTGLEALSVAAAHRGTPIHVLITDMIMPQMGGGELAGNFVKKYPNAKIVFTSGYTDHSVVRKWLEQGCRFLQKPYSHAELLLMIREMLDKKG